MPSHMTALGFPVSTEQDFRHYVYQASEFGEKIESLNGSYTMWRVGNGIELWVQTNLHRRIIGMRPHFSGEAQMRVGITTHVSRNEGSILDGTFYAWADPQTAVPESGKYAFLFDPPNYDIYHDLYLPCLTYVQLTGFAHYLQGFESDVAYCARQGKELRNIYECMHPSGPHTSLEELQQPVLSEVIFSGRILKTEKKINPVTGQQFYWAWIHTLGGEIDIVADPQVVQGKIVKGGIVSGLCWLSGKLA